MHVVSVYATYAAARHAYSRSRSVSINVLLHSWRVAMNALPHSCSAKCSNGVAGWVCAAVTYKSQNSGQLYTGPCSSSFTIWNSSRTHMPVQHAQRQHARARMYALL